MYIFSTYVYMSTYLQENLFDFISFVYQYVKDTARAGQVFFLEVCSRVTDVVADACNKVVTGIQYTLEEFARVLRIPLDAIMSWWNQQVSM